MQNNLPIPLQNTWEIAQVLYSTISSPSKMISEEVLPPEEDAGACFDVGVAGSVNANEDIIVSKIFFQKSVSSTPSVLITNNAPWSTATARIPPGVAIRAAWISPNGISEISFLFFSRLFCLSQSCAVFDFVSLTWKLNVPSDSSEVNMTCA